MPNIRDARILILATHGVEQSELSVPRDELRKAGAKVDVASPEGQPIRAWKGKDWGDTIETDLKIADISAYNALVLPGGQINPDLLRIDPDAMKVVKSFAESGKPMPRSAMGHGCSPRRMPCAAVPRHPTNRSAPTSRTQARTGWIRKSWLTRD